MIIVWFILILEMFILNLIGSFFIINDIFYFFAILLNMIVVMIVLSKKMYRKDRYLLNIILLNTIMKLMLAYLIVYHYEVINFIPHLGKDEHAFFRLSTNLSKNLFELRDSIRGGAYVKLFSLIFSFVGVNKFFGQYINILLFLTSYMIYYDNFRKLDSIYLDLFILFLPHQFIITSSFLRESIIIFFVTLSIKYFLVENYNRKNVMLAIISNLIASIFHSGVIVMSIVYIYIYIL